MEENKGRPHWDDYFMQMAEMVATRSTCNRANVGAIIVKDKRVLSTGYNGSPAGLEHCDEDGHEMEDGHCVRTIHAELNAITIAAKNGVSIDKSEIYITHFPCYHCFKILANVGIKAIYYKNAYRPAQKIMDYAKQLGIELQEVKSNE